MRFQLNSQAALRERISSLQAYDIRNRGARVGYTHFLGEYLIGMRLASQKFYNWKALEKKTLYLLQCVVSGNFKTLLSAKSFPWKHFISVLTCLANFFFSSTILANSSTTRHQPMFYHNVLFTKITSKQEI